MDTFDIAVLAGVIGFALGYMHKTLYVENEPIRSAQQWLQDGVQQCVMFGSIIMDEEQADKLNCLADLEGQTYKVTICKDENEVNDENN